MQIIFFDYTDKILFVRDDIESGTWTQEEMSFNGLFPFNPDKRVTRGMRLGFTDSLGTFQLFEVRKVKTYEPDHYQEVTGESIAISELSNEFYRGGDILNKTPQQAVSTLITGTNWNIGTVTATNVSSANMSMGDVWNKIRIIEKNWNVLIIPRIEVGANGITGRYLDIAPNDGTWRGLRLSLEKNADEVGVTIDDTDVLTALYGFGHTIEQTPTSATDEPPPLTFKDVVWQATQEHPAKPAGQEYIEDPTATALYGRNGRPRFGFYQNADITDANTLLQKTWESLRETNKPTITIDCLVRDLYRMGYQDQPIRLHDKAIVEIRPTGETYTLDVIKVAIDLLDPTATRVTIGHYIPNIIYIQRDTRDKARGGGGSGGRGQTQAEYERQEYETEALRNAYNITFKASQNDLNTLDGVVRQSVVDISAQGVTISTILNNVGNGTTVTAATIATSINNGTSGILLSADRIDIQGIVTAMSAIDLEVSDFEAATATIGNATIDANGYIKCTGIDYGTQSLGKSFVAVSKLVVNNDVTLTFSCADGTSEDVTFSKATSLSGAWSGLDFTVTATPQEETLTESLSYSTSPAPSGGATDTTIDKFSSLNKAILTITASSITAAGGTYLKQFTVDASSVYTAGETAGAAGVTLSAGGWTAPTGTNTVTASNGQTEVISLPTFTTSGGTTFDSNHKTTVTFSTASVSTPLKSVTVDASSVYSDGETAGAAGVTLGSVTWSTEDVNENNTFTVTASNGQTKSQGIHMIQSGWSNGSKTVRTQSPSGTNQAHLTVSLPTAANVSWSWSYPAQGYIQATITIAGKQYSSSHTI